MSTHCDLDLDPTMPINNNDNNNNNNNNSNNNNNKILFIEGSLISARALFGATRVHSYNTRMASLIRTRLSDLSYEK